MKLLKGQVETIERDGIKLEVRVIDTATQAIISDLSLNNSIEGRIRMVGYMLRNVIETITHKGVVYDPKYLASNADISDSDTLSSILNIGGMVISVAFPSSEEEKKLQRQQPRGLLAENAKPVTKKTKPRQRVK